MMQCGLTTQAQRPGLRDAWARWIVCEFEDLFNHRQKPGWYKLPATTEVQAVLQTLFESHSIDAVTLLILRVSGVTGNFNPFSRHPSRTCLFSGGKVLRYDLQKKHE